MRRLWPRLRSGRRWPMRPDRWPCPGRDEILLRSGLPGPGCDRAECHVGGNAERWDERSRPCSIQFSRPPRPSPPAKYLRRDGARLRPLRRLLQNHLACFKLSRRETSQWHECVVSGAGLSTPRFRPIGCVNSPSPRHHFPTIIPSLGDHPQASSVEPYPPSKITSESSA